ncbi:hypothetical protein BABINDRAFT_35825 [Babjeviella inositovora NRRL Y-12698]|uniref:Thioredoxin domain-containing protein n=1 Tax=Babjeviella inositovora NRRL Y-12698 TaxID=984486 RepID=A0A1E3QT62_9ASCO|nr:uncharacterized protein BABINDRAFT_35825 [Babjeviella inositovora NRRL Y-12698]ODQ80202.1 hypothetical protein BABINDRAFT_35825 [Babjeviella inositovora NRRL Y-12698]
MSSTLQSGEKFPSGVVFQHIPLDAQSSPLACSRPIPFDFDAKTKGKKVVIVSVPGAFTPTCTENHIPAFVENFSKLTAKGADYVIVLSANDPFVLNAWGNLLGGGKVDHPEKLIWASDGNAEFASKIGFGLDLTSKGMGPRTGRFAIIVDDGKVVYSEIEPAGGVTVSGYDAVLAKL